jgi:hypothetical protein
MLLVMMMAVVLLVATVVKVVEVKDVADERITNGPTAERPK